MRKKFLCGFIFSIMMIIYGQTTHNAEGATGFIEEFSSSTLDTSWQVVEPVSGVGDYSLTDNPGYLRYKIQGTRGGCEGWRYNYIFPWPGAWAPSLTLIRSFDGDNWVLNTKLDYNLHWRTNYGSTGAQVSDFYVAFGNGTNDFLKISRGADYWYSANNMEISVINNGLYVYYLNGNAFLAPDDVDINEWLRHSYWYQIERHQQEVTISISFDGITYLPVTSFTLPATVEATQRVIHDQVIWTSVGSYMDWDYVRLVSAPDPAPDPVNLMTLSLTGTVDYIQLHKDSNNLPCDLTLTCTINNQKYTLPAKAMGTQLNLALQEAQVFGSPVSLELAVVLSPFSVEVLAVDFN